MKSKKKFSSGGAQLPILFLIITVGILLAGGYFVYKTIHKGGSSLSLPGNPLSKITELAGGNAMPRATEADFAFVSDPLVKKNFVAQANTTKYSVTSTSDGRGAGEQTTTDIALQSQTDIRFHTKMVSQGQPTTEMIMIGDTTYLKDQKDGSWWMETAKPAPTGGVQPTTEPFATPEDVKTQYEQKQKMTYKSLGQEACGSLTCYKYEETDANDPNSSKRTFWFDTKDYLLRKETNGFGEFTSTNTYAYDNISVDAPTPTKPVPDGKSIYEMMMPDSIQNAGADLQKGLPNTGTLPNNIDVNKIMKDYAPQQDQQPTDAPADTSGANPSDNSGY